MADESDDVIGLCSECHSEMSERFMTTSPFAQAGISPPCALCGGVVVVVYRADRDGAIKQMNRERGLT